jgi:hypothetical protein
VVDVYADDVWLFAEHCPRPAPDQARLLALRGKAGLHQARLGQWWREGECGFRVHFSDGI